MRPMKRVARRILLAQGLDGWGSGTVVASWFAPTWFASPGLSTRLCDAVRSQAYYRDAVCCFSTVPNVSRNESAACSSPQHSSSTGTSISVSLQPPKPVQQDKGKSMRDVPVTTGISILQSGQGFKKTFYKRKLPSPPAIEFAGAEGRALFAEALQGGTMSGFFKLMEQFSMQDEPAFCGLSSLSMVLNALSIDPRRIWKGAWRWFHEAMLDCCTPLEEVRKHGITLTQAACLARCNGAKVDVKRHGAFSMQEFREQVLTVCTSGEEHMIVSYTRKSMQQTGDGHFSPIGGYHKGRDLVLILDTARFKYPPHWVPLPLLFEAMAPADPSTGLPRGYLLLSCQPQLDSVMFSLDVRSGTWQQAAAFARGGMTQVAKAGAASGCTPHVVLASCMEQLPRDSTRSFVVVRQQAVSPGSPAPTERCVPHEARQQLLTELRAMPLYQVVKSLLTHLSTGDEGVARAPPSPTSTCQTACCPVPQHALPPKAAGHHDSCRESVHQDSGDACYLAEKATLLLLLQTPSAWPNGESDWGHDAEHAKQWAALMDLTAFSIVEAEVAYLRQQFVHLDEVLQGGSLDATCGGHCNTKLDCAAHGHV